MIATPNSTVSVADAANTLRIDSEDAVLLLWVRDPRKLVLDGSRTVNEVLADLFPTAQRLALFPSPAAPVVQSPKLIPVNP